MQVRACAHGSSLSLPVQYTTSNISVEIWYYTLIVSVFCLQMCYFLDYFNLSLQKTHNVVFNCLVFDFYHVPVAIICRVGACGYMYIPQQSRSLLA